MIHIDHKTVLEKANKAIPDRDHETFLGYCTDDVQWTFAGDRVLSGKDEIRGYMADTYKILPKFDVEYLIEKGDYMTAVGTISLLEENGLVAYDYCDVWRFENGLMA